jgi:hypothetical protein
LVSSVCDEKSGSNGDELACCGVLSMQREYPECCEINGCNTELATTHIFLELIANSQSHGGVL